MNIKKYQGFWSAGIICLILISGCNAQVYNRISAPSLAGEKTPDHKSNNIKKFPSDIGWIDIKKDFGAKGDGITDDTEAIKQALNSANLGDYTRPIIIYFPQGTYLISEWLKFPQEGVKCCVTFQGQGQDLTKIQLQDSINTFGNINNPRPIIQTRDGNIAFRNYIRDLTINTGSGNPGAVGIDYISNNRGAIENVNIVSGDGAGIAGINMARDFPGPSLIKNVTVDGFDYGILVRKPNYSMTLEHITLRNQQVAGISNRANSLAIRGLTSFNSVPVLENENLGLTIVVDGNFQGGADDVSAINNDAYFYGRNIRTQGYRSAIQDSEKAIPGSFIQEYLSHQPLSLFDSPPKSLNLPVEETPMFHDNNLNNWANVKNYPSIQAAMNSGKSTIYFPRGEYKVNESISVPANVRKIIGFESFINLGKEDVQAVFKINRNSSHPLIVEGLLLAQTKIQHNSPRTLVIKHTKGAEIINSEQAGKLFLEDVQMHLRLKHPQNVWARQLNSESLKKPATKIINNGGNLWILGLKTEGKGTVIETNKRGKTELLGTLIYPVQEFEPDEQNQAAFISRDSSQSLIYTISSASNKRMYSIQVRETHQGETKSFATKQMEDRVMPLFVSEEK